MQWTAEQLAYIEWLATPKKFREPATVEKLAEQLQHDPATLWRWSKTPGFREAVSKASFKAFQDFLPGIAKASLQNMLKPEGWQERVAYYRYILPAVQKAAGAELEAGYFDELNPARQDTPMLTEEQASELFSTLDHETQYKVARIMQSAKLLPAPVEVTEVYTVRKDIEPDESTAQKEVDELPHGELGGDSLRPERMGRPYQFRKGKRK